MEIKKINFDKKFNRIGFFKTLSLAAVGFVAFKSLPFKIFKSNKNLQNTGNTENSRVKINPLAVSRKKIGGSNV